MTNTLRAWERHVVIRIGKGKYKTAEEYKFVDPIILSKVKSKIPRTIGRGFQPGTPYGLEFVPYMEFRHFDKLTGTEKEYANWDMDVEVMQGRGKESKNNCNAIIYNIGQKTLHDMKSLFENKHQQFTDTWTEMKKDAAYSSYVENYSFTGGFPEEKMLWQYMPGLQIQIFAGWGEDWVPLIYYGEVVRIWGEEVGADYAVHFECSNRQLNNHSVHGSFSVFKNKLTVLTNLLNIQPLPWKMLPPVDLVEPEYKRGRNFDPHTTVNEALMDTTDDLNMTYRNLNNQIILAPSEGAWNQKLFDSKVFLNKDSGMIGTPIPNIESRVVTDTDQADFGPVIAFAPDGSRDTGVERQLLREQSENDRSTDLLEALGGKGTDLSGEITNQQRKKIIWGLQLQKRGRTREEAEKILEEQIAVAKQEKFEDRLSEEDLEAGGSHRELQRVMRFPWLNIGDYEIKSILQPYMAVMHYFICQSKIWDMKAKIMEIQTLEHRISTFNEEYWTIVEAKILSPADLYLPRYQEGATGNIPLQ